MTIWLLYDSFEKVEAMLGGIIMAPTATVVNELLNTLEAEDFNAAISYIQFLSSSRKKKREEKNLAALSAIQNMFADDKGWESEEEMLADMADFRRERLK